MKIKKIVLAIAVLLPLIITFLPYIMSFTSDVRPDVPGWTNMSLYFNTTGTSVQFSNIIDENGHEGINYLLIKPFLPRMRYGTDLERPYFTPLEYPFLANVIKMCDTVCNQLPMPNITLVLYFTLYSCYILLLELMEMIFDIFYWIIKVPKRMLEK